MPVIVIILCYIRIHITVKNRHNRLVAKKKKASQCLFCFSDPKPETEQTIVHASHEEALEYTVNNLSPHVRSMPNIRDKIFYTIDTGKIFLVKFTLRRFDNRSVKRPKAYLLSNFHLLFFPY